MKRTPNVLILAGFAGGAIGGILANLAWKGTPGLDWAIRNVADPVGQIFLRLLLMVVIPLVFATLAVGTATLGGLRGLGRIGIRTLGLYLGLALIGAVLGVTLAALVHPGAAVTDAMRTALVKSLAPGASEVAPGAIGVGALVNLVPSNVVEAAAKGDLLGVLTFTLLFGMALASLPPAAVAPVLQFLEGVAQVAGAMVRFAMRIAPLGVAGLAFAGFARFGFEFLRPLGLFVAVVVGGLALHQVGLYGALVRFIGRRPPVAFFAASQPAMVTAFATASSNATLPTTLRVAQEELGVAPAVAGFVVPLGASLSRAGTALFTAATALFLAQALGVAVSPVSVAVVVALATVTAVAAGGIPSGVIPLLATVVAGAGVPSGAIALILGVEPLLGMARTVVNVTGALVATVILAEKAVGAGGSPPTPRKP